LRRRFGVVFGTGHLLIRGEMCPERPALELEPLGLTLSLCQSINLVPQAGNEDVKLRNPQSFDILQVGTPLSPELRGVK
jgi:hypothetical protein